MFLVFLFLCSSVWANETPTSPPIPWPPGYESRPPALDTLLPEGVLPSGGIFRTRPIGKNKLKGEVTSIAFLDGSDILVVAYSDGSFATWDPHRSGATPTVFHLEEQHTPWHMVTSSSGRRVAAWHFEIEGLSIYDTQTGSLLSTISEKDLVYHSAAFSPDEKFLVTTQNKKDVTVWDVSQTKATLAREIREFEYSDAFPMSPQFSPDGKNLVVLGARRRNDFRSAVVFEIESGNTLFELDGWVPVGKPWEGVWFSNDEAKFTPDGKWLAIAAANRIAFLNTETWQRAGELTAEGPAITGLSFSKDGKLLISGANGGPLHGWSMILGTPIFERNGSSQYFANLDFATSGLFASKERGSRLRADVWQSPLTHQKPSSDFKTVWENLRSPDKVKAWEATVQLASHPRWLSNLSSVLTPSDFDPTGEIPTLESLLVQMGEREFAKRQRALRTLEGIVNEDTADKARWYLTQIDVKKQQRDRYSLEILTRLRQMGGNARSIAFHSAFSGCSLSEARHLLAVQAVEHMATKEALDFLKRLSQGSKQSSLTKEAVESFHRLQKRFGRPRKP